MTDLPLTGGCMCWGVRYELSARPVGAGYCHCTRCQRRSGTAASPAARIVPGSLRIVRGADLVRAWQPPDGFAKAFCATCGSALWSSDPETGEAFAVRMGTFDADPGIRPAYRQYLDYAADWEPVPRDGLDRYDELRPG